MTQLLTVSGSLRANSSNSSLLSAAARLAPDGVVVAHYTGLATLPAFNPDLDDEGAPVGAAVAHWRAALGAADAILFSSPEYAHGIPGALKNALDWVVGSGELVGKPVGMLSASTASGFAHPQLVEVLMTMSALVVSEATAILNLPRRGLDAGQLVTDPMAAPALRAIVAELAAACGVPAST